MRPVATPGQCATQLTSVAAQQAIGDLRCPAPCLHVHLPTLYPMVGWHSPRHHRCTDAGRRGRRVAAAPDSRGEAGGSGEEAAEGEERSRCVRRSPIQEATLQQRLFDKEEEEEPWQVCVQVRDRMPCCVLLFSRSCRERPRPTNRRTTDRSRKSRRARPRSAHDRRDHSAMGVGFSRQRKGSDATDVSTTSRGGDSDALSEADDGDAGDAGDVDAASHAFGVAGAFLASVRGRVAMRCVTWVSVFACGLTCFHYMPPTTAQTGERRSVGVGLRQGISRPSRRGAVIVDFAQLVESPALALQDGHVSATAHRGMRKSSQARSWSHLHEHATLGQSDGHAHSDTELEITTSVHVWGTRTVGRVPKTRKVCAWVAVLCTL